MSITATTRILHSEEPAHSDAFRPSWIWPLPEVDGLTPRILTAHDGSGSGDIQIGYAIPPCHGEVPVLAAQSGIVAFAGSLGTEQTVSIDHAGGWSTQYNRLDCMAVRTTDRFRQRRKERVHAGDIIGYMYQRAPHIRFGLFRLAEDEQSVVDPASCMHHWSVLPGKALRSRL